MEQVMTRCMVKTICIYRISAAKHLSIFPQPSLSTLFLSLGTPAYAGGVRRDKKKYNVREGLGGEGMTVCSSSTKCELVFINMK